MRMLHSSLLLASVLAITGSARAQELVPARVVPALWVEIVRPNPYDVWQFYAVDNYGRFRPRVAEYPDGLRYVYNGQPFPWAMNYPHHVARGPVPQAANFEATPSEPVITVRGFTPLGPSTPVPTAWEKMPHVKE